MSDPGDDTGPFREEASPPHKKVGGRSLLPAPVGGRGDWAIPPRQDPQDLRRHVLVVRERRVAVPTPPLHGYSHMGATGQEVVERHREGVRVKTHKGVLSQVVVEEGSQRKRSWIS